MILFDIPMNIDFDENINNWTNEDKEHKHSQTRSRYAGHCLFRK